MQRKNREKTCKAIGGSGKVKWQINIGVRCNYWKLIVKPNYQLYVYELISIKNGQRD